MRPWTLPLVLICAGTAHGANLIRQWNTAVDPSKYSINQGLRRITILAGDTETFKFEAFDDVTGEPGDIDAIVIDQDGAGTVNLMVFGDSSAGRLDGARHLKKIDLTNTLSGTLVQLRITGDLGENGGAMIPDDVTGSVLIAGDLLYGFWASNIASGFIVSGDLSGTLVISDDLSGSLTIGGRLTGSVVVGDDVLDTGANYIHIHQMDGGTFSCDQLQLKRSSGEPNGWFRLGHDIAVENLDLLQTGTININKLTGVLYSRTRCALNVNIGEIDAPSDVILAKGGVYT